MVTKWLHLIPSVFYNYPIITVGSKFIFAFYSPISKMQSGLRTIKKTYECNARVYDMGGRGNRVEILSPRQPLGFRLQIKLENRRHTFKS